MKTSLLHCLAVDRQGPRSEFQVKSPTLGLYIHLATKDEAHMHSLSMCSAINHLGDPAWSLNLHRPKFPACEVRSLNCLISMALGHCDSLFLLLAILEASRHNYILWEGTGKGKEIITEDDEVLSILGLALQPHRPSGPTSETDGQTT